MSSTETAETASAAPLNPTHPKAEWVRRFAYRAMLLQPAIDSISAGLIADSQFDEACDLEPEDAAEIYAARD
ncbi:MAG TPA: hypothetical protein VJO99_07995 [Burkholderiaceae bacterium]|nr:hypothetical protein [Burkholderiaceae bacterium]